MNLAQLLWRSARVDPAREAVALGTRVLYDYAGLAARVGALAARLRGHFGLAQGERVALFMHNGPAGLETLYAIWAAGLVAVPINPKLHPAEASWIVEDAGARLAFASAGLADGLAAQLPALRLVDVAGSNYQALLQGPPMAPAARAPDDLAWLFYTSGTTGRPKGVMLTHGNLLTMTLCYFADVTAVSREDSTLYAAPMSHGAGLYSMAHMLAGARHVVPESGAFEPDEILRLAAHFDRLSMFAAPTMVRRLVEACATTGDEPRGLATVVYGGGPMYVEDMRRALQVMGQRFVQIYGQGESPMTITALSRYHHGDVDHPRYLARLGSVGVAQSAVEVCVAGADGMALPVGEIGEILVRGASVMQGYWQQPQASAHALQGGWLHTGDLGVLDADGFLTLKDRSKDLIISGGANIYPREVEEVLLAHPMVAEVSVVGRPDATWGEQVVAFVVVAAGQDFDPARLDAHCLAHIARFKRPRAYLRVEALPKNNYGKVLKTALRAQLPPG